jgi:hypothetical protein
MPASTIEFARPSSKYLSLNVRSNPSRSYAFVEFRSTRDAEDAYYDMYVISACTYFTLTHFPLGIGMGGTLKAQGLAFR